MPMLTAGHWHCGDPLPIGAVGHHGGHHLLVRPPSRAPAPALAAAPVLVPVTVLPSRDQSPADRPVTVAHCHPSIPCPLQDGWLRSGGMEILLLHAALFPLAFHGQSVSGLLAMGWGQGHGV